MGEVVWVKLTLSASPPILEALGTLLVDWGTGGLIQEKGSISVYLKPEAREEMDQRLCRYARDLGRPLTWTWESELGEPWRDAWRAYFKPVRASERLAICPSWEEWNPEDPRVRVIRMDPGRAFGTGAHETTRLCLSLIDQSLTEFPVGSFLDVGCGSGVLAIGALLLGVSRAAALDIDFMACSVARENARRNGVDRGLNVLCGDLRALRGVYDLVAANILYQVLLGLAPQLAGRVSPGGRLVLSGMLEPELASAAAVYGNAGMRETQREVQGDWGAMVLTKT